MRTAQIHRVTKETDIQVKLNLDGSGNCHTDTSIGFFDHMINALTMHSGIDLDLKVVGDIIVDCHHSVEDAGIVLGQAFAKALGVRSGITRYGHAWIPMDEALARAVLDISGRPFLVFDASFTADAVGDLDTQMVEEFFRAFAFQAGITLHICCEYGKNDHHKIEAIFKAVAHALKMAIAPLEPGKTLSTKGVL